MPEIIITVNGETFYEVIASRVRETFLVIQILIR